MKEAGGILWWPRWVRSLPGCCGEGPFSVVYSSEYDKRALVSPTAWQQFFLHPETHTRPCHDLLGGISLPRQVF